MLSDEQYLQTSISPSSLQPMCSKSCGSLLSGMQIPRTPKKQLPALKHLSLCPMPGSKWDCSLPACITILQTHPQLLLVPVDGTTQLPGDLSLTCKWTWHRSSPSAELKLGHIPGETLIKQPHILHLVISGAFCHCIAWQVAYASFLPGAQCPESQLEPVNWTNLNCQCMFVVGCLRGTGSTTPTENLGQRKPAQRCQLRKKKE